MAITKIKIVVGLLRLPILPACSHFCIVGFSLPQILATDITKMISEAWKALSDQEKAPWEQLARQDRARYEQEKAAYTGPWRTTISPKPKMANAPKRPVSAFVAYSNERRKMVTRHNPHLSPAEISGMLGQMWKHEVVHVRQFYTDQYARQMLEYRRACQEEQEQESQPQQTMPLRTETPKLASKSTHAPNPPCSPSTIASIVGNSWCQPSPNPPGSSTRPFCCRVESPDDGSSESNTTLWHIEQCGVLDPWEAYKQKIMENGSHITLTEAMAQKNFVPLTKTDTDCFLTVAAAWFEPLESNQ